MVDFSWYHIVDRVWRSFVQFESFLFLQILPSNLIKCWRYPKHHHTTQQNASFDSDRSPKPIERPVCTWKANGNSRRFVPHQSGKFDPRSYPTYYSRGTFETTTDTMSFRQDLSEESLASTLEPWTLAASKKTSQDSDTWRG